MSRVYEITVDEVSVNAVCDLLQVKCNAHPFRVLRQWIEVADPTLPAPQTLPIRASYLTAAVTDGNGAATISYGRVDHGDAAHDVTAIGYSTTQATTSGTREVLYPGGFYVFTGHERMYSKPTLLIPGQSFILELKHAPAAAIIMSWGVEVEEFGG